MEDALQDPSPTEKVEKGICIIPYTNYITCDLVLTSPLCA